MPIQITTATCLQELKKIHPDYRRVSFKEMAQRLDEVFNTNLSDDVYCNMLDHRLTGFLQGVAYGQRIDLETLLQRIIK